VKKSGDTNQVSGATLPAARDWRGWGQLAVCWRRLDELFTTAALLRPAIGPVQMRAESMCLGSGGTMLYGVVSPRGIAGV